jgi:outer membrane murein-binding lipoprotein Lpp
MKLAIMGLSGALLLAGCASSPQLEDKASLIEYQLCLDEQARINQEIDKIYQSQVDKIAVEYLIKIATPDPKTGLLPVIDYFLKNCEKYRP